MNKGRYDFLQLKSFSYFVLSDKDSSVIFPQDKEKRTLKLISIN